MQLGTGSKLDNTKDCKFINQSTCSYSQVHEKNFHISLPLMEPIHMAREDREHAHTDYCPVRKHLSKIFLGGAVPPGPENPYPISDQNIRFSIPYFRPDSQNVYPISDPVMCGKFDNSR